MRSKNKSSHQVEQGFAPSVITSQSINNIKCLCSEMFFSNTIVLKAIKLISLVNSLLMGLSNICIFVQVVNTSLLVHVHALGPTSNFGMFGLCEGCHARYFNCNLHTEETSISNIYFYIL